MCGGQVSKLVTIDIVIAVGGPFRDLVILVKYRRDYGFFKVAGRVVFFILFNNNLTFFVQRA